MSKSFKLGRQKKAHDPRIPKLEHLHLRLGATLTPPPSAIDYTEGLPPDLGMMLNDHLGDCTCAAVYHAIQVWSYHTTGKVLTYPDDDVELLYEYACGYDPHVGGEGAGGNEQNVLTYLLNTGAPINDNQRHKISAFVQLDVRNSHSIKAAINDCGIVYLGFMVPSYIMPPNAEPPTVWDLDPNWNGELEGGHAVIAAGYDDKGIKIISWGKTFLMTWPFWDKFVEEAYAIADTNWVTTKNTTPLGMTLEQLEEAMTELRN